MTELLVIAGLVGIALFVAFLYGKSSEKEKTSKKAADISKKQAEIAVNAPKGKDEIIDILDRGDL